MSLQIVHSPGSGPQSKSPITVNGRKYMPVAGSPQTVPAQDAAILCANGWLSASGLGAATTGATAARPVNPQFGTVFHDTTVGAAIIWDGTAWRHHMTGGTP